MREKFRLIPNALRRQILLRFALGGIALVLFPIVLLSFWDVYFSLPCLLLAGFMTASGSLLVYHCCAGRYVTVRGICSELETRGFRKKTRALYIDVEDKRVKIPIRRNIKRLRIGDTVTVYLSPKTPIYEQDSILLVCDYHAIDIRRGT